MLLLTFFLHYLKPMDHQLQDKFYDQFSLQFFGRSDQTNAGRETCTRLSCGNLLLCSYRFSARER